MLLNYMFLEVVRQIVLMDPKWIKDIVEIGGEYSIDFCFLLIN